MADSNGGAPDRGSGAAMDALLTDAVMGPGGRWVPGLAGVKAVAKLATRPRTVARRGAGLAAELAAVEHQHIEALGRGIDGGGEPGRPGADDDDIIFHRLPVAHAKGPLVARLRRSACASPANSLTAPSTLDDSRANGW